VKTSLTENCKIPECGGARGSVFERLIGMRGTVMAQGTSTIAAVSLS
jgi:hypothetical protein